MTDALRIESDLAFSVTGPSGPLTGRVEADGAHVTVRSTEPVAVLGAVLGIRDVSSAALGGIGDQLAEAGITLDVVGPQGAVVTAGAGVNSRAGALFAGSSHVRLDALRAALPLARARFGPVHLPPRLLLAAAATLLAGLVVRRGRR